MSLTTPPTISKGATGQLVKNAQGLLLAHGAELQGIDGKFGPRTEAAARAFQHRNRLGDDGIIGPETWGALLAERPEERGDSGSGPAARLGEPEEA
jgi:peptidoglycan hydrolase-like protein with peptidoglycan-binding domain